MEKHEKRVLLNNAYETGDFFDSSYYKLDDFIVELIKLKEKNANDYKYIEFCAYSDDNVVIADFYGIRNKTPEEIQNEEEANQRMKTLTEEHEKRQLAALKAKYESGS